MVCTKLFMFYKYLFTKGNFKILRCTCWLTMFKHWFIPICKLSVQTETQTNFVEKPPIHEINLTNLEPQPV